MPLSPHYRPDPRITTLGEGFYDVVTPARFPRHVLRYRNQAAAARVGLGELDEEEWRRAFGELRPLAGNLPAALALRYHGHQFRVYNRDLGDGRGFLHAQLRDPVDGRLLDLGTKGSGQTPWSRGGDGRLTLKGGVREALATEQLEALGVPTSRTLSVLETGEELLRGDEPSPTRSCVLVRLSHGHLRIGTFQRLHHLGDRDGLLRLVRYAAAHYLPEVTAPLAGGPAAATDLAEDLLRAVCARVAALGASYLAAGFVHGVLNSDNINITGESFDYGPYRFLPRYDPAFVAAYFDHGGLYAFGRQGEALLFGLERLAESLEPLLPAARAGRALCEFLPRLFRLGHGAVLARLGLAPREPIADSRLVANCLCFLQESQVGYDRFFFDWYGGLRSEERARRGAAGGRYQGARFSALRVQLAAYEAADPEGIGERLARPYFQGPGPCSLLIEEIEALWRAIAETDDWSFFENKITQINAMRAALTR